jgi:hypothetical protein
LAHQYCFLSSSDYSICFSDLILLATVSLAFKMAQY